MSLDLIYERMTLERIEAENTAETVVEGSLVLPDRAAEIGRALKLQAVPKLNSVEVKDGKVVFEGAFDLFLLYAHLYERRIELADRDPYDEEDDAGEGFRDEVVIDERLETASWKGELPFVYLLDLAGIAEGDEVETHVDVRSTSFEVRSDRLSLDVDVVVAFAARKSYSQELTVAKAVKGAGGIDVERQTVRVVSFLGRGGALTEARGQLNLSGRAVPERFLEVRAFPVVTEATVDDQVVRVRGYVNYAALYVGAEGAGPQYGQWARGAAFETEAEIPTAVRGAACQVKATPLSTEYRIVEEEGTRQLEVRTPVALDLRVQEIKEVAAITGLDSREKEVAARRELLRFLEAVGEGRATFEEGATLDLPQGQPGIERILFGDATAAVDDVHVLGDKVAVELHVDVDLFYVGRSQGDGSVWRVSWPRAVELDLEIPVNGAEPGLERKVNVQVVDVQFDLLNRESVDVLVRLAAEAQVSREVEFEAVAEAVEAAPLEADPPTYTYVVVRPGDTVWKLAAYYRTTPELVLAANPWLESQNDPLPVGKKVCIPRKAAIAG